MAEAAEAVAEEAVAEEAVAEAVAEAPELLDRPDEVAALTDRLAEVQRAYLRASKKRRCQVDEILGL